MDVNEGVIKTLLSLRAELGEQRLSDADYTTIINQSNGLFESLRASGILAIDPRHIQRPPQFIVRGDLGCLPRSIIDALGIGDLVARCVIERLVPRCLRCGQLADPPHTLEELTWPSSGVVALALAPQESDFSLQERCELLGCERAVVGGFLLPVEDLKDKDGEPVIIALSASRRDLVGQEVRRWFARGGGELRVLYFSARDATAQEIGRLLDIWSCGGCGDTFTKPTRSGVLAVNPCQMCKGTGWFPELGGRFIECRDCCGFGSKEGIERYDFLGVNLRDVATLNFTELLECIKASACDKIETSPGVQDAQLLGILEVIINSPFKTYPLGASIDLMSRGEMALLTVLLGEISQLRDAAYVIDGALGLYDSLPVDSLSPQVTIGSKIYLVSPDISSPYRSTRDRAECDTRIVLRDIRVGPLDIAELIFPVGKLSTIRGSSGSGKSLLLSMVANRFMKKKQLGHLSLFGSAADPIRRCVNIDGLPDERGVLLDLLGLSGELALEVARTRKAQELGLQVRDLELPQSKYRCSACYGVGVAQSGEECDTCAGALYDWRIADLDLSALKVRDVLTMPLSKLSRVLWYSDRITAVLAEFSANSGLNKLSNELSLATPVVNISLSTRRFLAIFGGLMGVFARSLQQGHKAKMGLNRELVLIDGPRAMTSEQTNLVGDLLDRLVTKGTTVIYANIPVGLEESSDYVVDLVSKETSYQERARANYLDLRYSRRISARAAIRLPNKVLGGI